ncbi:MAG: 50S ribosomal protein L11 methyltransferase [Acidiferrobacterales bacterium]
MPWLKFEVEADHDQAEPVAQALEDCGALAVTVEDARHEPQFEDTGRVTTYWTQNRISALFPTIADVEAVVRQITERLGKPPVYTLEMLGDVDWQAACRAHFTPMQFGSTLWVCPSWVEPPQPDAVNVFVDPGLAFGTGTHPTTRLCLEWLATRRYADEDVIDYGCGSGILAIAALKLGAGHAWGVDNDPRALAVSTENATRNHVGGRYRALPPEPLSDSLKADIVLANILAEPLGTLAPDLTRLVRPSGMLVLSGVLHDQVDSVRRRYAGRFSFDTRLRDDKAHGLRWAILVGSRIA